MRNSGLYILPTIVLILTLLSGCGDAGGTRTQSEAVEAMTIEDMNDRPNVTKYVRLFADEQGESHFEDNSFLFQSVNFAPPAPPLDISVLGPAEQCFILRANSGWKGDWHPAPFRQLHFYLSGEVEAETSDGEVRRIGPGTVVLVEDTSGRGHRSRVVGTTDVIIAVVRLSDEGE